MATFEFVVLMTVHADSEEQAMERAENTMQNEDEEDDLE
jgi:hypothetical protein